ncbi:hypothetical protein BGZ63DRAFT_354085 [Mariannaea sp. PMI_226]|nr:hypothetical protein BGZ63DRAFT_354085 [Mariannaea sp. PMI_226]
MALPPQPDGLDLTEDRSTNLVCAASITWGLAVITVIARIVSRRLTGHQLVLDDWLIIVSLLFSGGSTFLVAVYFIHIGLGKHVWALPPDAIRSLAIGVFAGEITYTLTIVFVKLSLLALYCRIFFVYHSMKILAGVLGISVITWGISLVVTFTQCIPLRAFWERFDPINPIQSPEYSCGVNLRAFFYGIAIPNIVLDIFIIVLPLPYIWKLHLRTSQKVSLTIIFTLGLFLTATSIIRFIYLLGVNLDAPDLTWSFVNNVIWTVVEGNIATFCACLPVLRPLLNLILYRSIQPGRKRSNKQPKQQSAETSIITDATR